MNTYPCGAAVPDTRCLATPTYPARECTSYAAWMGSQKWGQTWPLNWGNAGNWPNAARKVNGFSVDGFPAIGSVMALGPGINGAGPVGHVGWVERIIDSHSIWVSEYDFLNRFGYDERQFPIVGALFIHLPRPNPITEVEPVFIAAGPPAAGAFLVFENGQSVPIGAPSTVTNLQNSVLKIPSIAVDQEFINGLAVIRAK